MKAWPYSSKVILRFACLFIFLLFFSQAKTQCINPLHRILPFKSGAGYTLMNLEGQLQDLSISFPYISEMIFEKKFIAGNGTHYGMISSTWDTLLPFVYDTLFREQSFIISKRAGKNEILSCSGANLVNEFDSIIKINADYSKIYHKGKTGLITPEGKLLIKMEYDGILVTPLFHFTLLNQKFGAFNQKGKEVFKPEWDEVLYHNDSIIKVRKGHYWVYAGDSIKIDPGCACPLRFEYHGYYTVMRDSIQYLYTYKNGTLISNAYEDYFPLRSDRIVVRKNNKVALCNDKMKMLIGFKYDQINWIDEDLYAVAENLKFGVVKENEKIILPLKYTSVDHLLAFHQPYSVKMLVFFDGNKKGVADYNGNIIIKPQFQELLLKDRYVIFSDGKLFGLLSYSGKTIVPAKYSDYWPAGHDLIKFRSGNKQIICNQDTLLSKGGSESIYVSENIIKSYRGKFIDIVEYDPDQSKIIDSYTYENISSYEITEKEHDKWDNTHFFDDPAVVFRDQQNGKWGVRKKFEFKVTQEPVFDEILPHKYDGYIALKYNSDTSQLHVPGLIMFSNTYYTTISNNSFETTGNYFYTDHRNYHPMCIQNSSHDMAVDIKGKTDFITEKQKIVTYVEEPEWCVSRFYTDGKMELTREITPLTLNRYYTRLNREHNLRTSDEMTIHHLYKSNYNIKLTDGLWRAHENFSRLSRKAIFNGTQAFQQLHGFRDSLSVFSADGINYGLIHINNKVALEPEYVSIEKINGFTSQYWFKLKKESDEFLIRVITNDPNLVRYNSLNPISHNRYIANKSGKWGIINEENKIIIPFEYNSVKQVSDSLYACSKSGKYELYNFYGRKLTNHEFTNVFPANNNMIRYERNGMTGFMDKDFNLTEKLLFDEASDFTNGKALVKKNKKTYLIQTDGKVLHEFKSGEKHLGKSVIFQPGKKGSVFIPGTKWKITGVIKTDPVSQNRLLLESKKGMEFYIPGTKQKSKVYKDAEPFKSAFTMVSADKQTYDLIDTNFNIIYNNIESFKDFGEIIEIINNEGQKIYISGKGKEIKVFDNLKLEGSFDQGIGIARNTSGKRFYIDLNGKELFPSKFEIITPFKSGYAAVKMKNKNWGVINTKGEFVIQPNYYSLTVLDQNRVRYHPFPLCGLSDNWGIKLFDEIYDDITPLNYDLFKITLNGETQYVNRLGKVIQP